MIAILIGLFVLDNGLPRNEYGLLSTVSQVLALLAIWAAGRTTDHLGARRTYWSGFLFGHLFKWTIFNLYIFAIVANPVTMRYAFALVMIPIWPFLHVSQTKVVSEVVPERELGTALGLLALGAAMGALLGQLVAGFLADLWMDSYGIAAVFRVALLPIYAAVSIAYLGVWRTRPALRRTPPALDGSDPETGEAE